MKKIKTQLLSLVFISTLTSCSISFDASNESKDSILQVGDTTNSETGNKTDSSTEIDISTETVNPDTETELVESLPSTEKENTDAKETTKPSTEPEGEVTYNKVTTNFDNSDLATITGYPYTPNKGTINLLAIPVIIEGYESTATPTVRNDIKNTLFGDKSSTAWESVKSFYSTSSLNNLTINGTVSDWYTCGYTPAELDDMDDANGAASNTILKKAIDWYKIKYSTDCKEFDNDGDGFIDGVFLIYSAPDAYTANENGDSTLNPDIFWAYTTMDYDARANVNNPTRGFYFWASYDFMYEGYGTANVDAHTFIHETGHMLGLDDYYSYNYTNSNLTKSVSPLGGLTMMDHNVMDLDAYSKFALGWSKPYIIDKPGTLTISRSNLNNDSIIIPTKKNTVTNAFDEYVMLELFSPTGLNLKDATTNYSSYYTANKITTPGIKAYHVDSRLCQFQASSNGSITNAKYVTAPLTNPNYNTYYYGVSHTNTPSGYDAYGRASSLNYMDSNYRLITQLSKSGRKFASNSYTVENQDLYHQGDSFSQSLLGLTSQLPNTTKMNNGSTLAYNFTVVSMTADSATLQFTAN